MLLDAGLLLIGAVTLLPYFGLEFTPERAEEIKEAHKLPALSRKLILSVLASVLLFNFALGSFRIFLFAGLRELAKAEVLYGVLQSLQTAGGLFGLGLMVYFAHRRGLGVTRPLIAGMLLQSLALLLVGFPLVPVLVSAVLIVGFGGQLLNVSFDSLMQKVISLESLGSAKGLFDALATFVIPLSQLAFAWAIERSKELSFLAVIAFSLALTSSVIIEKFWKDERYKS